mmetsp:Transcript_29502/g.92014  ORF Transcript_29502/g.92014 Transcript_29502/m.92014 type:complete len:236 (+) Transcript_29502:1092-1799(+)
MAKLLLRDGVAGTSREGVQEEFQGREADGDNLVAQRQVQQQAPGVPLDRSVAPAQALTYHTGGSRGRAALHLEAFQHGAHLLQRLRALVPLRGLQRGCHHRAEGLADLAVDRLGRKGEVRGLRLSGGRQGRLPGGWLHIRRRRRRSLQSSGGRGAIVDLRSCHKSVLGRRCHGRRGGWRHPLRGRCRRQQCRGASRRREPLRRRLGTIGANLLPIGKDHLLGVSILAWGLEWLDG